MIDTLRIYVAQRFSSLMFLSLAVFLFLYSVPLHALHPLSLLDLLKVFLMLWVMRLYDDVMQWENDAAFSERIYTNSESRSKLILPLVFSMATSVCISWSDGPDFSMASLWLYFMVVNHVMYKALVHRNFWAFVLPLIKYPFLFFYMTLSYGLKEDISIVEFGNGLALFFAFVVYDLLDSQDKDRPIVALYFLIVLCFVLLFLVNVSAVSLISGTGLLVIALILIHLRRSVVPIFWLLIILIFKLILNNYVI